MPSLPPPPGCALPRLRGSGGHGLTGSSLHHQRGGVGGGLKEAQRGSHSVHAWVGGAGTGVWW